MGRWAQAVRRGAGGERGGGLEPPPAPSIEVTDAELLISANGAPDTGGKLRLYGAESPAGPPVFQEEVAWIRDWDWGEAAGFPNQYAWASEVGNGSVYAGESALAGPVACY